MRWAAIVCLALFGCSKPPLILELDEGTRSLVVVIDDETQPRLRAFDVTDGFVFRDSFDSGPLILKSLMYERSLQELGLLEGDRVLQAPSDATRGLPAPEAAYLAEGGNWSSLSDTAEAVSDVAFARTDARECIEQGGCLADVEGLPDLVCRTPCTEPPRPIPPEAPAPPDLGPCPAGWTEGRLDGNMYCEPWPDGIAPTCADGEVAWPGGACGIPGPGCPADGWPTEAATLFVDPASGGGTGTRADPFASIDAALLQATAGDVIALRRGSYASNVDLVDGVSLVGACLSEVVVRPPGSQSAFTVPAGVSASLSNITIQGNGAAAEVEGQLAVTAMRMIGGEGFRITGAGRLEADSVWIERGRSVAFNLRDSAQVEASRVASFDTQTLFFLESAGTTLTASVTYSDRGTTPVYVSGGEANLFASVLEDASLSAIYGQGADSVVSATQLLLRQSATRRGGGVQANTAATLNLKRVAMINQGSFASMLAEGADIFAEDVIIATDEDHPNRPRGVGSLRGATVEVRRLYLTRPVLFAAYAFGVDGRLRLFDTQIIDVRTGELGSNGSAIQAEENGYVRAERVVVEKARGIGVYFKLDARFEATDLVVRTVLPRTQEVGINVLGRGMEIVQGASADVTRAQFLDNRNAAVFASDTGTEVKLAEAEIAGTGESDCYNFWCQTTYADGSSIILQAVGTFTNVWVHDNTQYGLRVQTAKGLRVTGGLIERNAIGLETSHPDFDFADVSEDVLYRDNGVTVEKLAR